MALTKKQLEDRKKRVGASDVSAIMGLNPYQTEADVWALKTGRVPPFEGNAATRLGDKLEPVILDFAEEDLGGVPFQRNVEVEVNHTNFPMVATLDGQTETGRPVEAKTAGLTNRFANMDVWGEEDTSEVPEYYLVQVQAQLMATGADMAFLYALLAGRGFVRFMVHPSNPVMDAIQRRCEAFWKCVEADTMPTGKPLSLDVLKRMNRTEEVVQLGNDADNFIDQWSKYKADRKEADANVKATEALLLTTLGDAQAGVTPRGRSVSYLERNRKSYTVKASTYRQLGVKE